MGLDLMKSEWLKGKELGCEVYKDTAWSRTYEQVNKFIKLPNIWAGQ